MLAGRRHTRPSTVQYLCRPMRGPTPMTQSLEAPERKRTVMVSIAVGVDGVFEAA